jgi:hypothetical protein
MLGADFSCAPQAGHTQTFEPFPIPAGPLPKGLMTVPQPQKGLLAWIPAVALHRLTQGDRANCRSNRGLLFLAIRLEIQKSARILVIVHPEDQSHLLDECPVIRNEIIAPCICAYHDPDRKMLRAYVNPAEPKRFRTSDVQTNSF